MTSAHHEEVGRRVGAAGDSSSSRGPGRSGGGKKRKAFGWAAGGRKKPLSPFLSNLIWGWGEGGN